MEFNLKKWVQVMNLFAHLEKKHTNKSIDKLKMLKLVWVADRLHLRKYWKPIVWDTYFAMEMWPVASGIKYIFDLDKEAINEENIVYIKRYLKKFSYKLIAEKEVDYSLLSDSNVEIIEKAYLEFWNNNSSKLINITHKYPEWKKHEQDVNNWKIVPMSYLDFFENTPAQDQIFDMNVDDLEITKEIFIENQKINSFFSCNYA
jgi:uncharacterized phage-associated protein